MVVEINTHKIDYIKLKKNIYLARLHLLKILSKNKYFYFLKIKINYIKHNRWVRKISLKIKYLKKRKLKGLNEKKSKRRSINLNINKKYLKNKRKKKWLFFLKPKLLKQSQRCWA